MDVEGVKKGGTGMKKVEAIIRPGKIGEIKEGLARCGISGMTVTDVLGCGQQKGYTRVLRGSAFSINLRPKVKLEIIIPDEALGMVVDVIIREARTGEVGDGKIFVYPVDEAYRIRTGDSGASAI